MSYVVLVGHIPPPWGGVGRHLVDLAELLEDAGMPYRVVDLEPGHRPAGPGLPRAASVLPADRVVVPASRLDLPRTLYRVGRPGAVFHVHINGHNRSSWAVALMAGAAARARGCASILTLHSGLCPGYLSGARSSWGQAAEWGLRATLATYDRVICVNAEIAAALRDLGVPPAQLKVLPAFSPRSLEARRRRGVVPPAMRGPGETRWVGAALSPLPEYGADIFFEAMGQLIRSALASDVRLAVFGPGVKGPWVDDLAFRAGLQDRTAVLGELGHADAVAVMERLAVFVRPSRADGDSVSVREALALGRPAVATTVGHRPEGVVLVPPGDPGALAQAVGRVLACPPLSPPVRLDSLPAVLTLYRELLGSSARAPGQGRSQRKTAQRLAPLRAEGATTGSLAPGG